MRVLSLFDGMACGALALHAAEIEIDRYVAYEIDKYAVQTSTHNFPFIEHRGDVFKADFTEYKGFDLLCGGSPCTYWSIAQKNNRETEASGIGWDLFSQYVRALREAEPKFFIYENNKSMSKAIRTSITETFGFEPVLINSALVSAQNRQRLYWVGKRNADGTYSKVNVEQPEDRGILLRDILETGDDLLSLDKSLCVTARISGSTPKHTIEKHIGSMVAEPLNTTADGKSQTIRATCYKDGIRNMVANDVDRRTCVAEPVRVGCMPSPDGEIKNSQGMRVYSVDGKSVNQTAQGGGLGAKTGLYAVPCGTRQTDKSRTLRANYSSSSQRDFVKDIETNGQLGMTAVIEAAPPMIVKEATIKGYAEIDVGDCVDLTQLQSKTRRGRSMKDKSNCLTKQNAYYQYCGTIDKPIYEVKNGQITIKGKQYPIKLADGYYIIRKLTVRECMRLQTVPEWYEFPVSNSQAYKMLGNGWTVEVIAHILKSIKDSA